MSKPSKNPRVLIVDDNATLADNLSEILEGAGYVVRAVGSCLAARQAALDGFDVGLVDLRLPDGNGTALAAELKERSAGSEVVLLTGFATVETAAQAVRAGAFAYLVKPCATGELLLTIEQALRQVRLLAEKRELQRRAQVAERLAAVGTMTAGLSHEIRNPLNAALLQLNVLDRQIKRLDKPLQAPLKAPLEVVQSEIRRLDHILEDFLQFARPRELVAVPLDLAALLGGVLDLLATDARKRRVRLERDFEPVPLVLGEAERLRQVAINLTLNALDATPSGGWVRLSTRAEGDTVMMAVEDGGTGIRSEDRLRIFEPFFTTKPGGSGLGLPIVHAIVTQHGGTVAVVDSDQGARFEVRLSAARS